MDRILKRFDVGLSCGSGLRNRERREQQKQPGPNSPETSTEHVYSEKVSHRPLVRTTAAYFDSQLLRNL